MKRFFHFLDTHAWAPWVGMALCFAAVGYIEAHPQFPFNLF